MIRSMTAFSRVTGQGRHGAWVLELRSLNHRYFDCSFRLPPDFFDYESQVRDIVRSQITRGKISVNISRGSETESQEFQFDDQAVGRYLKGLRRLQRRFSVPGEITMRELVMMPQLLSPKKTKEPVQKEWRRLEKLLKQAVRQMIAVKKREGQKIVKDIAKRLGLISRGVARIEQNAANQSQIYFEKLKSRLSDLLNGTKLDEEKVWREAAVLADRSDITEEIVRMKSHLELFGKYLQRDNEVGRELDFLCQEMHREVNTMGAKTQIFDISREVVALKGEIEKIREQVQNVE